MADEQLARTKAINMRHVYVIGVIALARTRVPAGENSPTVRPLYLPLSTDLSSAFNVRPILTSLSYYTYFRVTLLGGKINIFFFFFFFFLSKVTKWNMEIDIGWGREERRRRFGEAEM